MAAVGKAEDERRAKGDLYECPLQKLCPSGTRGAFTPAKCMIQMPVEVRHRQLYFPDRIRSDVSSATMKGSDEDAEPSIVAELATVLIKPSEMEDKGGVPVCRGREPILSIPTYDAFLPGCSMPLIWGWRRPFRFL